MNKKDIAIIIPTIERDDLLISTIDSIIAYWQPNWRVYIIDQNENDTKDKQRFYRIVSSEFHDYDKQSIHVERVPYNSGLSYCRNKGVELAKKDGIPYCLIGADSIYFDKSMANINDLIRYFKRYDLLGLDISNRIKWEAKMKLIEGSHFELDFINTVCKTCNNKKLIIWNCDIVRNFFLAKTEYLDKIKWDQSLLMREHEDFFYRFKQEGLKVGYTNWCNGIYKGDKYKNKPGIYKKLRDQNMREGLKRLKEKYNITGWVKYKNLENIHKK